LKSKKKIKRREPRSRRWKRWTSRLRIFIQPTSQPKPKNSLRLFCQVFDTS
jgi:hypothetical protein